MSTCFNQESTINVILEDTQNTICAQISSIGPPGPKGDTGAGVASGGTTGQILVKKTNTDYDTQWIDNPALSNQFDNLQGRPKYNNQTMSSQTNIPEVKTQAWDNKYSKPDTGIPKSDMSSNIQTSLEKADTALQSVPDTYRTAEAQDIIDAGKQPTLVSGTNIKTINNQSVLGSGNIQIDGVTNFDQLTNRPSYNGTSMTHTTNIPEVKTAVWDAKQAELVSGTNIKTINNQSILGSGNLQIDGGVTSVNGQTGAVVLDAEDVGALPDTTVIPTKTSQLQNDSGFLTQHQSLSAYRTAAAQDIIDAGKQPTLPAGSNNTYLHKNAITGNLEWSEVNSAVWGNITGNISSQTDLQTALDNKSTVSVSEIGTSVNKVKYITIDGVQSKIGADDATDESVLLESELYTYAPIGVLQTEGGKIISYTNPKKVADAGDSLKDVFNAVFGEATDSNPTINQSGTTFTKSGQTGTTSVSGAEIGQSISSQTGTVTFTVNNTATCSYGLKAGELDTYSKTTATTFNYPVKTRTINSNNYQIRIKYPELNGCTLSVTSGTLVLDDTTNRYLYCHLSNSNTVTISIAIPSATSTASAQTRFGQLEADVEFNNATYNGIVVDNFWTYLKNSYTATGKSHSEITGVKSTAYSITAGTRYAYSKVTNSSEPPTVSLTKQAAESTFGTSGADFNYSVGDYIYMYRTTSGRTVQTYVLGQWASVSFLELSPVSVTQANGATCTYYPYKVGPMEATGSAKYRV